MTEVREIGIDRKLQHEKRRMDEIGEKNFCITRVDENTAEQKAAYPDDGAAEVEWGGLHHGKSPNG